LKRVCIIYSILTFLIVFANITGCGVKGNPVMLSTVPDNGRMVQNLSALSDGNAVHLNWDFYGRDAKISYIAVEKSELGSAGNECRDCPRTFERIGQVPVEKIGQENREYNHINFTDVHVLKGKIYSYRLKICHETGVCQESQTVEIDFK
jgi:hypothetical protein